MKKVLLVITAAATLAIGGVVIVSNAAGSSEPRSGSEQTDLPDPDGVPEDHDWEKDPIVEGPAPETNEDFWRDANEHANDHENERPPDVMDRPGTSGNL
ncbi:hypothetical protein [Prescottella agglutinans]|uniref:hypothetical protein n=1 Tax=Prescottella agglutinans TaxID=1644129 RepID=UPI003D95E962